MKKVLNIIALQHMRIYEQLHLEELLLRCTTENFFIWNKDTTEKAIVMGFSAKPLELLNIETVKRDKIPVIRRYTGGGTVIVDHQTLFSTIIMNHQDADTQPYPREIMVWSEKIYGPAFQRTMNDPSSIDQFRLREHDYVIVDKKIGGNAQSIIKNRWVHHTSFLWNFTSQNMDYLQLPKKRPEYRQNRTHTDFLLPLSTKLSSVKLLEQQILQELAKHYSIKLWSQVELQQHCEKYREAFPEFKPRTSWEDLSVF